MARQSVPLLYQDQYLVVVDKPAAMAVHRGWAQDGPFALQVVRDQIGRRVFPAHRLDRATSGVLIFALDPGTAATLGAAFAEGKVRKEYLALVRGKPPESQLIDHPLRMDTGSERVPAQTQVVCLAVSSQDRCALVLALPLTGRLHQVRRHLKHISHPIVGDVRYGKGDINRHFRARWGVMRLALHACRVTLNHPATREPLVIEAAVPPDLADPLEALGLGSGRVARGPALE